MTLIVDKSLGIELRNSPEHPDHYVSICGCWLQTTARPNYLRYYKRTESYKYLKCCAAKFYMHRLVGFAWVFNPCPTTFDVIDHIDRDSQNNHASNLRWVNQHLNCLNRKVKGFEKIRKQNGAIFYRSRVIVEGNAISKFCRSREEAIRETNRVQCESFDQLYQRYVEEKTITTIGESTRSAHHLLWTDPRLETPEGVEYNNTRDGGHCADRYPQFTFYDTSEIIH